MEQIANKTKDLFSTGVGAHVPGKVALAAKTAGVTESDMKNRFNDSEYVTDSFGRPIPGDGQHALNIGGHIVLDTVLMEKQFQFNMQKIVERRVHAVGSGHFGYIQMDQDNVLARTTLASCFQSGVKTPTFVRFSTVTLPRGWPDLARNPRGMAFKLYTEEGNLDIVGLNWPIFFARDPMQGADIIKSQEPDPITGLLNWDSAFDFLANVPEGQHGGLMLFSDSATPNGYRHHGYGVHAFRMYNAQGESTYVKFTWSRKGGQEFLSLEDALAHQGDDPQYSQRDMFEQIEQANAGKREYPEWEMHVQMMTAEQANACAFEPFDATKVWPRSEFPLQKVGSLVLNKNPDNYFRDVEQAAFSPGSLVPGIDLSPDPLFQWRAFFYRQTQQYRLGANLHQIPVNTPFMSKYYRPINGQGNLRADEDIDGTLPYQPNSKDRLRYAAYAAEPPMVVPNAVRSRQGHGRTEGTDAEYDQARELYSRVMDDAQRDALHKNTAYCMQTAGKDTIERYLAQITRISPAYVDGIVAYLNNPATLPGRVRHPPSKSAIPQTCGQQYQPIKVDLARVGELAKRAHLVGKAPRYVSNGHKLGGKDLRTADTANPQADAHAPASSFYSGDGEIVRE
ncbi:hypothetical protein PYCC9005_003097 [Savitreella phatthalungensis]